MPTIPSGPKGEIWVLCAKCGQHTRHSIEGEFKISYYMEDPYSGPREHKDHQLLRCLGCDSPTLRINEWDELMDEPDYQSKTKLFPPRLADRPRLSGSRELPDKIEKIYDECLGALAAELNITTGIAIRALIEATCKELSIGGKNLKEMINNLQSKGYISSNGRAYLHDCRFLGNESAHDATASTLEDLNGAMDIAEHLLREAFILKPIVK